MSADYETLMKWQLNITLGLPKPEGLTTQESHEYDNLERRIDTAAKSGSIVSFPSDP
jgi:hypothetical protein